MSLTEPRSIDAAAHAVPSSTSLKVTLPILQEKKRNQRLGQERTLDQFREIMANLDLPYPKFIDYAVPGNQECGLCPDHLPENLEKYCGQMTETPQG